MVALVTCIACQVGEHDDCRIGKTQEGVIGGWMCDCSHEEKSAMKTATAPETTRTVARDDAVEAWIHVWPFLDLRDVEDPSDVPWPPLPYMAINPRQPEGWPQLGYLPPHTPMTGALALKPERPAMEGLSVVYGFWARVAAYGEVGETILEGQPQQHVVGHGVGSHMRPAIPERTLTTATIAEVTAFAAPPEERTYLHFTHWWFTDDDGNLDPARKYVNTEQIYDSAWLAEEFAKQWGVPLILVVS